MEIIIKQIREFLKKLEMFKNDGLFKKENFTREVALTVFNLIIRFLKELGLTFLVLGFKTGGILVVNIIHNWPRIFILRCIYWLKRLFWFIFRRVFHFCGFVVYYVIFFPLIKFYKWVFFYLLFRIVRILNYMSIRVYYFRMIVFKLNSFFLKKGTFEFRIIFFRLLLRLKRFKLFLIIYYIFDYVYLTVLIWFLTVKRFVGEYFSICGTKLVNLFFGFLRGVKGGFFYIYFFFLKLKVFFFGLWCKFLIRIKTKYRFLYNCYLHSQFGYVIFVFYIFLFFYYPFLDLVSKIIIDQYFEDLYANASWYGELFRFNDYFTEFFSDFLFRNPTVHVNKSNIVYIVKIGDHADVFLMKMYGIVGYFLVFLPVARRAWFQENLWTQSIVDSDEEETEIDDHGDDFDMDESLELDFGNQNGIEIYEYQDELRDKSFVRARKDNFSESRGHILNDDSGWKGFLTFWIFMYWLNIKFNVFPPAWGFPGMLPIYPVEKHVHQGHKLMFLADSNYYHNIYIYSGWMPGSGAESSWYAQEHVHLMKHHKIRRAVHHGIWGLEGRKGNWQIATGPKKKREFRYGQHYNHIGLYNNEILDYEMFRYNIWIKRAGREVVEEASPFINLPVNPVEYPIYDDFHRPGGGDHGLGKTSSDFWYKVYQLYPVAYKDVNYWKRSVLSSRSSLVKMYHRSGRQSKMLYPFRRSDHFQNSDLYRTLFKRHEVFGLSDSFDKKSYLSSFYTNQGLSRLYLDYTFNRGQTNEFPLTYTPILSGGNASQLQSDWPYPISAYVRVNRRHINGTYGFWGSMVQSSEEVQLDNVQNLMEYIGGLQRDYGPSLFHLDVNKDWWKWLEKPLKWDIIYLKYYSDFVSKLSESMMGDSYDKSIFYKLWTNFNSYPLYYSIDRESEYRYWQAFLVINGVFELYESIFRGHDITPGVEEFNAIVNVTDEEGKYLIRNKITPKMVTRFFYETILDSYEYYFPNMFDTLLITDGNDFILPYFLGGMGALFSDGNLLTTVGSTGLWADITNYASKEPGIIRSSMQVGASASNTMFYLPKFHLGEFYRESAEGVYGYGWGNLGEWTYRGRYDTSRYMSNFRRVYPKKYLRFMNGLSWKHPGTEISKNFVVDGNLVDRDFSDLENNAKFYKGIPMENYFRHQLKLTEESKITGYIRLRNLRKFKKNSKYPSSVFLRFEQESFDRLGFLKETFKHYLINREGLNYSLRDLVSLLGGGSTGSDLITFRDKNTDLQILSKIIEGEKLESDYNFNFKSFIKKFNENESRGQLYYFTDDLFLMFKTNKTFLLTQTLNSFSNSVKFLNNHYLAWFLDFTYNWFQLRVRDVQEKINMFLFRYGFIKLKSGLFYVFSENQPYTKSVFHDKYFSYNIFLRPSLKTLDSRFSLEQFELLRDFYGGTGCRNFFYTIDSEDLNENSIVLDARKQLNNSSINTLNDIFSYKKDATVFVEDFKKLFVSYTEDIVDEKGDSKLELKRKSILRKKNFEKIFVRWLYVMEDSQISYLPKFKLPYDVLYNLYLYKNSQFLNDSLLTLDEFVILEFDSFNKKANLNLKNKGSGDIFGCNDESVSNMSVKEYFEFCRNRYEKDRSQNEDVVSMVGEFIDFLLDYAGGRKFAFYDRAACEVFVDDIDYVLDYYDLLTPLERLEYVYGSDFLIKEFIDDFWIGQPEMWYVMTYDLSALKSIVKLSDLRK